VGTRLQENVNKSVLHLIG